MGTLCTQLDAAAARESRCAGTHRSTASRARQRAADGGKCSDRWTACEQRQGGRGWEGRDYMAENLSQTRFKAGAGGGGGGGGGGGRRRRTFGLPRPLVRAASSENHCFFSEFSMLISRELEDNASLSARRPWCPRRPCRHVNDTVTALADFGLLDWSIGSPTSLCRQLSMLQLHLNHVSNVAVASVNMLAVRAELHGQERGLQFQTGLCSLPPSVGAVDRCRGRACISTASQLPSRWGAGC